MTGGLSDWNPSLHGDIGKSFEQHSHLDDVLASGNVTTRRFLVQIVHAWSVYNQDGVIVVAERSHTVTRACIAIEPYGPKRTYDGLPCIDIQFVLSPSVERARLLFDDDEEVMVMTCDDEVYTEIASHLTKHCLTQNMIDLRSGCKLYEGILALLPVGNRRSDSQRLPVTHVREVISVRESAAPLSSHVLKSNHVPIRGWTAVLGCTYKALQLFRVSLGFMLTLELLLRFRFLHAFYSDEGTLPTFLLLGRVDDLYKAVCLHCHLPAVWQQQILLSIQVLVSICFTLGVQTQVTSIVTWYLYFSLTLRNTWMSYILDRYFHYLLFLSMFLPLNGSSSGLTTRNLGWFVSPSTIALKLLVVWIYFDAGYGKYADPLKGWSYGADPLPALDTYARHTVAAQYLYALVGPAGLRLMTPIVVYIELFAAPVALISTYCGIDVITYTAIALICSLHVGIALTLRNSALLSFVACTAWCTFLPLGGVSTTYSRKRGVIISLLFIVGLVMGSVWLETISRACDQSVTHIWSTLLHNRWNVFVGAEEYVSWEIAPGLLQDGSYVDVWGRRDTISWSLPGGGAPCTATARPGRWRSFPYLANLDGEEGEVLWQYLCDEWDRENRVDKNPGRQLLKYNFFMLQADVLSEMHFSETRKRLVKSYDCLLPLGESRSLHDFQKIMTIAAPGDTSVLPKGSLAVDL